MEDSTPIFASKKRRPIAQPRRSTHDESTIVNDQLEDDNLTLPGSLPRKHKKQGIVFDGKIKPRDQSLTSTAFTFAESRAIVSPQAGRFVAPTGRAVVAEDKHMSAFVDAKLSENRTQLESSQRASTNEDNNTVKVSDHAEEQSDGRAMKLKMQPIPRKNKYQRFRRRQPATTTDVDIARDDLVDRIMQEGALPMYNTEEQQPSLEQDNYNLDRDSAAASAFKAEFLASLEERRNGRKATANTTLLPSTGPKLGGSRMAREKMKSVGETVVPMT